MGYHVKVLEDGQIVLPPEFGRDIGVRDGDSFVVERAGADFVIKLEALSDGPRQRLLRVMSGYSVDDFLAERSGDWRE